MLVKSTQHNKNTLQSSNNANAGKISYSPATMQMLVKYPTATMQIITTVQQTKSGKQMLEKFGKQRGVLNQSQNHSFITIPLTVKTTCNLIYFESL